MLEKLLNKLLNTKMVRDMATKTIEDKIEDIAKINSKTNVSDFNIEVKDGRVYLRGSIEVIVSAQDAMDLIDKL